MAKKKPKVVEDDSYLKVAQKNLMKILDASNFISADAIIDRPKKVVPLTPILDVALNGGIPEGSFSIFSGKPKCGKTVLALQAVKNAIKMGKRVYWVDIEERLSRLQLSGINGLDASKITIIRSEKGKLLTGQDKIEAAMSIIRDVPECVVVMDSYSSLCSSNEMNSEITAQYRNEGPKLLASFCRRMAGVVPVNDTIVIGIQHLIGNQASPYGGVMEDGGVKIEHQTDTKMRCVRVQDWVEGDKVVGQKVSWKILFGALGVEKNSVVESWLRHGYGYDEITETITLADEFGIIDKGGAWYTMPNGDKFQGIAKLREALSNDLDMYSDLDLKIREMIA